MNKICVPGFDTIAGRAIMVLHEFEWDENASSLRHSTDGILRAVVPLEGLEVYTSQYPDAAHVIPAISSQAIISDNVLAIADIVRNDSVDNASQIAYLKSELAKLEPVSDNVVSDSPVALEVTASPGA